MSYISESIYQIYFYASRQIETIQDIEFDESYDYKEMRTIVEEEFLFFFFNLGLLFDSTFNISIRDNELPVNLPTLFVLHLVIDNNTLLFAYFSDDDSLIAPPRLLMIRYKPTQFRLVVEYIAHSSIAQGEICETLRYH